MSIKEVIICPVTSNSNIVVFSGLRIKLSIGDKDVIINIERVFNLNNERIRDFLFKIIPAIPEERGCICKDSLEGAVFSPSELVED